MFKHSITLDAADTIVNTALAKGREMGLQPLTVAVLDAGGQLKVLKRDDGSSLAREEIAIGKATACLTLGFGGREMARRSQKMGPFMTALEVITNGRCVPVPGGVLIRDTEGTVVGAVGVTGDLSENDETCAVAGIEAVGLTPDTGDPA